ncbi:hypothetical protein NKDENANG_03968 [Candidatus Entotheonellaceae bacterium PAL068K]
MQIVCPSCSKRLQIPDEKLPTDRQVRLVCPSCQERFTFDPHVTPVSVDAPTGVAPEPLPQAPAGPATARSLPPTPAPSIDITDAGPAPRALVCLGHASHRQACQEMLPSLGYQTVHVMSHQAEALAYLSAVAYEFCLLETTFDGSTPEVHPVLAGVLELPMDRRRYMLVTLCLPDATAADDRVAYSHAVNLVLNPVDIPKCHRTLELYLAENKRLYRIYREVRQQLGKDI